jgi:hypothetical protein
MVSIATPTTISKPVPPKKKGTWSHNTKYVGRITIIYK